MNCRLNWLPELLRSTWTYCYDLPKLWVVTKLETGPNPQRSSQGASLLKRETYFYPFLKSLLFQTIFEEIFIFNYLKLAIFRRSVWRWLTREKFWTAHACEPLDLPFNGPEVCVDSNRLEQRLGLQDFDSKSEGSIWESQRSAARGGTQDAEIKNVKVFHFFELFSLYLQI